MVRFPTVNYSYKGSIHGHQVTLSFEDKKGLGFDAGTYVFIVQNDSNTMVGMATFHGKVENRIVSEPRTLKKVLEQVSTQAKSGLTMRCSPTSSPSARPRLN